MRLSRRTLVAVVIAGSAALAGCRSAGPTLQPSAAATSQASEPVPAQRCTLDQLTASLGDTTGEGQRRTTIVWTNTSGSACVMDGYGGVDLEGPDDPMGRTYSLRRESTAPQPFTLDPGRAAHTTITWLMPQGEPGWTPTSIKATPPDETRSARLDWPGGAVLRQDGATHPGSFIGPVSPGPEG
jgi:hypothetical protein